MRASLLALCMLLAGLMAVQPQRSAPEPQAAARQVPLEASATPAGSGFTFAALERYGAIVERPVFYASRRPPREQAKAGAFVLEARELLLAGVLIMADRKLALLQQAGSPDIIRLRPGSELYDWVLVDVREEGVTLRRGTELRELRLQR